MYSGAGAEPGGGGGHLTVALRGNGYPSSFIHSAAAARAPREEVTVEESTTQEEEKPPLALILYVAGVSECIKRACRNFNVRVVYRSGPTLHSLLTKVKDPLPVSKLSNVVYEIPCECRKVYLGETKR